MEITVDQKIGIMHMAVTYVMGVHDKVLNWREIYREMLAEAEESNG